MTFEESHLYATVKITRFSGVTRVISDCDSMSILLSEEQLQ